MTVQVLGRRLPAAVTYAVALSAVLLLLMVAVGGAISQTNRSLELGREVRAAVEARGHLRLLMRGLQDAETGQRGYMLTAEENYLGPYEAARGEIVTQLEAVKGDSAVNGMTAAQISELERLVSAKGDELALTIDLRRRGRLGEAIAIIRSDRGREVMDNIRVLIGEAEARVQANVDTRMNEAEQAGQRLLIVTIVSAALLVAILVLLVFVVRRAMDELRVSRDEARTAESRMAAEMRARESAESKVRHLQKMETIGQITGGVAHDFNNMLAVIMSALQLAKRRMERGQEGVEGFIDSAMDGARRAAALTSRLLAFARRQPLQPSVIDVNRVLGDMSDMLSRTLGEQVDVETVLNAGLWRVNADRNELEQAVLNICINARDAMPNGGKLTIESANTFLDEGYAAANIDVTPGQYVMVAISDTGMGMKPEVRAQAFEPFFTTKEIGAGTGLGLSHVHGFLKQSGGHVAIYSEIGVGTTIKLYLPRTHLAEQEVAARAAENPEALAGDPAIIVLVVEDDERVRLLSVAALREMRYTVLHASGGAQALEMLDAHPGIALLFTDVVMPEMTGRQLVDTARAKHPDLKVLYTTGYTQNAIVHNGVLDADARLILKPYTLTDLAKKVRAALEE
jgi:signal transduction histidine kinase